MNRLSDADIMRMRHRLAPMVDRSEKTIRSLLTCAKVFERVLASEGDGLGSVGRDDDDRVAVSWAMRERLVEDSTEWLRDVSGGSKAAVDDSGLDNSASGGSNDLKSALKRNLSKKEAQSQLTPEDFKLWKKAQKSTKKRDFDDEERLL